MRADSATSRVAARSRRPSAGTMSPASTATMSPGTSCSAGSWASWPSRVTLALMIIIFCRAATAAAALPSCRRPSTALNTVSSSRRMPVPHLLERVEAPDPGHEEHDLHRVGVLAQEGVDAGLGRGRRELVRAERRSRSSASAVAEAPLRVAPCALEDLVGGQRVPADDGSRGAVRRHRRCPCRCRLGHDGLLRRDDDGSLHHRGAGVTTQRGVSSAEWDLRGPVGGAATRFG